MEARKHASSATSTKPAELHVCQACESVLVYPIDWAPAEEQKWAVHLRCPECEWRGEGIYPQDAVDRFDEILDDGSQAILDDLTKLQHTNMEEDIERFVDALNRDLLLPEDF